MVLSLPPAATSSGLTKILMATVKGDVHDIGTNNVGVVVASNGYEVIGLGVTVPAERILAEAMAQSVAMIGLSGLITPTLDELAQFIDWMPFFHTWKLRGARASPSKWRSGGWGQGWGEGDNSVPQAECRRVIGLSWSSLRLRSTPRLLSA